jgi:hypothetical protein
VLLDHELFDFLKFHCKLTRPTPWVRQFPFVVTEVLLEVPPDRVAQLLLVGDQRFRVIRVRQALHGSVHAIEIQQVANHTVILSGISAAPLFCLVEQFYEAVLALTLCSVLLQANVTLLFRCELDCFEE